MQNTVTEQLSQDKSQNNSEYKSENKMGVMPVGKLLIGMSLPMMISMLVQALYNIVDSIFVARISENALTAVSLAFPMQSLMIALAVGTAIGINAVLSKSLGEKDHEKVKKVANNGIFLAIVSYLVFLLLGIFTVEAFYTVQTRDADAQIVTYGIEYLTVILCCSFGVFFQITLERLLQSTGRTFYTMITQGIGAVINIILDPILIFGLLGFPAMGVRGAAIATVTGQIIASFLALYFNLHNNKEVTLRFRELRPDAGILKQIYAVGIPSIAIQVGGSIMVYIMNQILLVFSATATAVFGVYFKLQSFVFMPVFGLNSGMMPIVAYNYGARKKERLIKAVKLSAAFATAIMAAGFLAFQIFPEYLLRFFEASANMIMIGIPSLRIISISFLFAGFNIVCGSMFSALGNGVYSMIIATARQLVVLVPVAWLLSLLGKVGYVWWAFPIAEVVSTALTVAFIFKINNTIIRHIGNSGPSKPDDPVNQFFG